MNCRPGDLAMIISDPLKGRFVDVLEAAPTDQDFVLPDGFPHQPAGAGYWLCRSLGEPFSAPLRQPGGGIGRRKTRYAVIHDRNLKPIRPAADPVAVGVADEVSA